MITNAYARKVMGYAVADNMETKVGLNLQRLATAQRQNLLFQQYIIQIGICGVYVLLTI